MNLTRAVRISACLLASLAAVPSLAAEGADAAVDPAVKKPVQLVIGYVRQSKDDKALQQFASDAQGKFLMGDDWAKGTDAQRKEFTQLFQGLFAKVAFPKIRENLKNLAAVNPNAGKAEGDSATCDMTLVIDHPLKKQELKVKFTEVKEGGAFKVVDVKVLGDSMLAGVKDQIDALKAQGGWDKVLDAMRAKLKDVQAGKSL